MRICTVTFLSRRCAPLPARVPGVAAAKKQRAGGNADELEAREKARAKRAVAEAACTRTGRAMETGWQGGEPPSRSRRDALAAEPGEEEPEDGLGCEGGGFVCVHACVCE